MTGIEVVRRRLDVSRPSHRSVETGCSWMVSYPEVIRKMREVAMSDSGARGPWCSRCASRRVRHFPATAVSATMSKPNETPRKYQNWPSSCAATASGEDGDSMGVPRLCSSVLDGQLLVLAAESGWGIYKSVMPGGIGILSGGACARQRVVALDFQLATVEHRVMA